MPEQVVRGDPGGPYGCDATHVGDILGACVAAAACAGALVVLAALIPAAERRQTAPWIYVATVSVIVVGAAVFLRLAVFGPNLGAHECLS
jgi:subtilisin family serine protease